MDAVTLILSTLARYAHSRYGGVESGEGGGGDGGGVRKCCHIS